MAGRFVKQYVLGGLLEGMSLRDSEVFPDWQEDPNEGEIDAMQFAGSATDASSTSNTKYVYTTDLSTPNLNGHIRLLELLPGNFTDPIRCRLITHKLEPSIQRYESLSYCWGQSSILRQIWIDNSKLEITENLRSALRYLRDSENSRILWVDAICIDQSNFNERSAQVKLMGDVYCAAHTVSIWLGRAEGHTKTTFALARSLAAEAEQQINGSFAVDKERAHSRIALTADQLIHFEHLVASEWFERCWTVQEFLLAQRCQLICGREVITWQEFFRAILFSSERDRNFSVERHYGSTVQDYDYELKSLHQASEILKLNQEPERQLLALLSRFYSREASVPHDRIYAFLGIIRHAEELNIRIDYRISIGNLYRNVAATLISRLRNLDLLKFAPLASDGACLTILESKSSEVYINASSDAGHESRLKLQTSDQKPEQFTLPSWAPNWTANKKIALPFDKHLDLTSESNKLDGNVHISQDQSVLTLAGSIVDEIEEVSAILPTADDLGIMDGDDKPPSPEATAINEEDRSFMEDVSRLYHRCCQFRIGSMA